MVPVVSTFPEIDIACLPAMAIDGTLLYLLGRSIQSAMFAAAATAK